MSPRNSIGACAELRQLFARLVSPTVGRTWRPNGRLGTLARCHEDHLPRWLIACSAAALACVAVANAEGPQPVGSDAPVIFRIPAQPLATALQAYGQRAGVQVLYESDSAVGRQSMAVEGEFTRNQALELLLSGTNLEVHYTRSDAITLVPRGVRGKDDPPADPLVKADLSIGELRVRASSQSIGPLNPTSPDFPKS
jgi:hypothetical protein